MSTPFRNLEQILIDRNGALTAALVAVVDPDKPLTCGCLVVVAIEIDGKSHAFVRQFRERNAEGVVVRSLNPKQQDETLSFDWLKHVHRIVMIGDPL